MGGAAYSECFEALGCTEEAWAGILSRGRQGVLRAYQEGGVTKARGKMTKMLAAAGAVKHKIPPPSIAGGAPLDDCEGRYTAKKRRRRANARARTEMNTAGELTPGQLFELYAMQKENWGRVNSWLVPLKGAGSGRHHQRRQLLEDQWREEYVRFNLEFGGYLDRNHGGVKGRDEASFEGSTRALFISVVTQATQVPPNEAAAAKLWRVLEQNGLGGECVGGRNAI